MGSFSHKVSLAGKSRRYPSSEHEYCLPLPYNSFMFIFCSVGVFKQAPELGFRPFAAHWPRHGHREHTAFCWLQQTEYNTRCKLQLPGRICPFNTHPEMPHLMRT